MLLAGAICGCPLRWEIRNRNDIYCCAASSRGNFAGAVTEAHKHQRDPLLRDSRLMFSANWAAAFLQSRASAKKWWTHSRIQLLYCKPTALLIPIISEADSAHCMVLKKTKTFIWVISSWAAPPLQHLLPLMSWSTAVDATCIRLRSRSSCY